MDFIKAKFFKIFKIFICGAGNGRNLVKASFYLKFELFLSFKNNTPVFATFLTDFDPLLPPFWEAGLPFVYLEKATLRQLHQLSLELIKIK